MGCKIKEEDIKRSNKKIIKMNQGIYYIVLKK